MRAIVATRPEFGQPQSDEGPIPSDERRLHLPEPMHVGLSGEIARLLKPHRMHFRDESTAGTPGLPRAFYWGICLGDERGGA